jgi:hypothetical protein
MPGETKGHVRIRAIDERLARLRAERSRLARMSHTERKRDTRRKILVGAGCSRPLNNGIPALRTMRELLEWLDRRLTRPHDRAVFDLARRGRPSTDV